MSLDLFLCTLSIDKICQKAYNTDIKQQHTPTRQGSAGRKQEDGKVKNQSINKRIWLHGIHRNPVTGRLHNEHGCK